MRTHSRTVLLAVVLAITGLGASSCSKIGMLKAVGWFLWSKRNGLSRVTVRVIHGAHFKGSPDLNTANGLPDHL